MARIARWIGIVWLVVPSLAGCGSGPATTDAGTDGSAADAGRTCTAREVSCADHHDDDCDGQTDCADVDCASDAACRTCSPETSAAACGNGGDDDCDGAIDCADTDCLTTDNPACFGDWTQTLNSHYGYTPQNPNVVNDVQAELTADGFHFVGIGPGSATLELTGRGTHAQLAAAQVYETGPNQFYRTCVVCPLIRSGTHTYYPRRGSFTLTSVPSAVGDPIDGSFLLEVDEVTMGADGEVQPIAGSASWSYWQFHGVAVAGGVTGSGTGSHAADESGAGATAATPPPVPSCGDQFCGDGETSSTCPSDCPACGPSSFTVPGAGVVCPVNSQPVSRGRCECVYSDTPGGFIQRVPTRCDTGTPCTAGTCTGADWICIDPACGNDYYDDVLCPNGTSRCGPGATCAADSSSCSCTGTEVTYACGGAACSGAGCVVDHWYCGSP